MEYVTNAGKGDKTPLTDSEAVEQVIEILLSDTARLKARNEDEAAFFAIKASLAIGYSEPMTAEQRALNSMLAKLKMSYTCCENAWKLYHDLRS